MPQDVEPQAGICHREVKAGTSGGRPPTRALHRPDCYSQPRPHARAPRSHSTLLSPVGADAGFPSESWCMLPAAGKGPHPATAGTRDRVRHEHQMQTWWKHSDRSQLNNCGANRNVMWLKIYFLPSFREETLISCRNTTKMALKLDKLDSMNF